MSQTDIWNLNYHIIYAKIPSSWFIATTLGLFLIDFTWPASEHKKIVDGYLILIPKKLYHEQGFYTSRGGVNEGYDLFSKEKIESIVSIINNAGKLFWRKSGLLVNEKRVEENATEKTNNNTIAIICDREELIPWNNSWLDNKIATGAIRIGKV